VTVLRFQPIALLAWCFVFVSPGLAADLGIKVHPGFEVTRFAGDELAHDIFSITTDAEGRIAVSGPGYVKILEDRDGDGSADHAHLYAKIPSGALGMYFDGPDLIYTGDNKVARLYDTNGDRVGDKEEVWTQLGHQEHGSHHIVKGPDGWYYVAAGNDAGVSKKHATTPGSPIKDPVCGAILRFSPDGKQSEIVADGFRNMCGLDFNSRGHLFTVDSDNERDQHLPWYCPTRLFDVAIGQTHGWIQKGWQQGWNRPQYYFDSVERLVEIGRGSPTGVVVYRHRAWPKRYRDGVFSACWSMGRIYFFPLEPHGSSYKSKLEIFLEGRGATGLAIVGMTVDPAGDMYFAVGGRKTQGSVYRIRYTGPRDEPTPEEQKQEQDLRAKLGDKSYDVLTADQPLSNWSRAKWEPVAKTLGSNALQEAALDTTLPPGLRCRAIELMVESSKAISNDLLRRADQSGNAVVADRIVWAMARCPQPDTFETLLTRTRCYPTRALWEALLSLEKNPNFRAPCPSDITHSDEQRLQAGKWTVFARHFPGKGKEFCDPNDPFAKNDLIPQLAIDEVIGMLPNIHAVRQIERRLGDLPVFSAKPEVFVGYSVNDSVAAKSLGNRAGRQFAQHYPFQNNNLNREVARLLGILEVDEPRLPHWIITSLTAESRLEDDIHYLIVLARLPAARSNDVTAATARALALLHHKLAARGDIPSRNWPLRIGELFEELCNKDAKLAEAVINDDKFGLPEHSLFVSKMTGVLQARAARKLLAAVNRSGADWDTDLVSTLAVLPRDELRPHLREHWDDAALRDSIALVLAESPAEDSRALLIEALSSVQPNIVRAVADGLLKLDSDASGEEIAAALAALRRQTLAPNEKTTRQAITVLLQRWTGQAIDIEESKRTNLAAAYRPWFDWFAAEFPDEAKKLNTFAGDLESWQKRLAEIDWSTGDADHGKAVYEKRACHRCHSASGRLGPELAGAATRFSRDDLFGAIVDPNKEVAPPYQTTEVVTEDGQVYNGLVVYESPDTTMLQTGPDTVVRVGGVRKDRMRKSSVSLMPVGLLNDATDRDLSDLYAYLKSMAK